MTTETRSTTTKATESAAGTSSKAAGEAAEDAANGASAVVRRTQEVVADASAKLPGMTSAARDATRTAMGTLAERSTGQLKLGAAFSFGLATGIFVAGGPRIFVVAAAIPGAAMAMTLADRGRTSG